jgi:Asp/Glu/hydantoin racemase
VTLVNVLTRAQVLLATDPVRIVMRDIVYLEAALRAEAQGSDAVFVNTVGDFGLGLIRGAVGVPVVGAGEAAVRKATTAAQAFSIVTVWPSSTRTNYDRVLASTATADRCTSMHFVLDEPEMSAMGGGQSVMDAVRSEGNSVADRVLLSCKEAVSEGAEAIVLGCSCMAGLTAFLQRNLDVVVVDPLAAGYAATEAAAREAKTSALPRPVGIATEDTIARVNAAVDAWEMLGTSVPGVWVEDCGDACAVLA